jgi:hypothetical protein
LRRLTHILFPCSLPTPAPDSAGKAPELIAAIRPWEAPQVARKAERSQAAQGRRGPKGEDSHVALGREFALQCKEFEGLRVEKLIVAQRARLGALAKPRRLPHPFKPNETLRIPLAVYGDLATVVAEIKEYLAGRVGLGKYGMKSSTHAALNFMRRADGTVLQKSHRVASAAQAESQMWDACVEAFTLEVAGRLSIDDWVFGERPEFGDGCLSRRN